MLLQKSDYTLTNLEEPTSLGIPIVDVDESIKKAVSFTALAERVHDVIMEKSTLFSYKMIPFMNRVPSLYFRGS